jgi:hypothetical protein
LTFGVARPISAAETQNGLSANGLSANGLSANGLSANGLSANGLSANGLSANGLNGCTTGQDRFRDVARIAVVELADSSTVELF